MVLHNVNLKAATMYQCHYLNTALKWSNCFADIVIWTVKPGSQSEFWLINPMKAMAIYIKQDYGLCTQKPLVFYIIFPSHGPNQGVNNGIIQLQSTLCWEM